jgi:hypothetical protein
MKTTVITIAVAALALCTAPAQVPSILNYQGRVTVGGTNLTTNAALFKFALVDGSGSTVYWKNDGAVTAGEPATAVAQGLYSTLLGDTSLANMAAIPPSVFTNSNVNLRVWFSPGSGNPFVQLAPDQRIGASGYALRAAEVDIPGDNNTASGTFAVVGGGQDNSATYEWSTVGGGRGSLASGWASTVSGGYANAATTGYATVAGGWANTNSGSASFIGGGMSNLVTAEYAAVGGGQLNKAEGAYGGIFGGRGNHIVNLTLTNEDPFFTYTTGWYSVISGGESNIVTSDWSFVGSGHGNTIAHGSGFSSIGGGQSNEVGTNAFFAFIGGGQGNAVGSTFAVVAGGLSNRAEGFASGVLSGEGNAVIGLTVTETNSDPPFDHHTGGNNSAIGGGQSNSITSGQAFIGGGYANMINTNGGQSFIGGGRENVADSDAGTVGGGANNRIAENAGQAFIGGGHENTAKGGASVIAGGGSNLAVGDYTTIGGGFENVVGDEANPDDATYGGTIAGGESNRVVSYASTVGGGAVNRIEAALSSIGGGYSNLITSNAFSSVIGGGEENIALGSDLDGYAVVGGGYGNVAAQFAVVPGGYLNEARGESSFAAGTLARATNEGAFVWSGFYEDSETVTTVSTNDFSFTVRAPGGVRFITTTNTTFEAPNNGVILQPGGNSWASLSDSNAKTAIKPVDTRSILRKVASLPVTAWQYKGQPHRDYIGPMAQDFRAAFGLGYDDKTISTADSDGVIYAAIQGLVEELNLRDKTIEELKAKLDAVEQRLESFPPAP